MPTWPPASRMRRPSSAALIETVTVMPTPPGGPPGLRVQGNLDSLVGLGPLQERFYLGGEGGAG